MPGSLFPYLPELWETPEGKRIEIKHYRRAHDGARVLVHLDRRLEYDLE